MAKFSQIEKLAIWNAYKRKCFYCDIPIPRISNMHIEHIFPESLANKPQKFKEIKSQYDLPVDFDLNAYYNLVCSCSSDNWRKSNKIREKNVMLTYYSIAKEKEIIIKNLVKEYKNKLTGSKTLVSIRSILERKFLMPKEVVDLVHITEEMVKEVNNPLTITFTIYKEELDEIFYEWCDKCLDDITIRIQNNLSCLFAICEDNRNGEGYGVRIAFWGLDQQEFNENLGPKLLDWDIVEIMDFKSFYQRSAADLFFNLESDKDG